MCRNLTRATHIPEIVSLERRNSTLVFSCDMYMLAGLYVFLQKHTGTSYLQVKVLSTAITSNNTNLIYLRFISYAWCLEVFYCLISTLPVREKVVVRIPSDFINKALINKLKRKRNHSWSIYEQQTKNEY